MARDSKLTHDEGDPIGREGADSSGAMGLILKPMPRGDFGRSGAISPVQHPRGTEIPSYPRAAYDDGPGPKHAGKSTRQGPKGSGK